MSDDVQKIVEGIEKVMESTHDDSGYQGHCPLCRKQLFVSKYKTVDCPEGHYSASIPVFENIWNNFEHWYRNKPLKKIPETAIDKLLKDLTSINTIEVDDNGDSVEKA